MCEIFEFKFFIVNFPFWPYFDNKQLKNRRSFSLLRYACLNHGAIPFNQK